MPVNIVTKTDYQSSALPIENKWPASDVNTMVAFVNALESLQSTINAWKQVVDPNGDGVVDLADALSGASSASSNELYGKDNGGSIGFHDLVTMLNTAIGNTDWQTGSGGPMQTGTGANLNLSSTNGYAWDSISSPSSVTSFTTSTAATPVNGGFVQLYSNAASLPTFDTTIVGDFGYTQNYSTGDMNLLIIQWINGGLEIHHIATISSNPSNPGNGNLITDISILNSWWNSLNIDGTNNSTITDAQDVTTIQDNSSNNIDGTTAGASNAPYFRASDGALVFNGTSDYLTNVANGITSQPFTISTVFTPRTGINDLYLIWSRDSISTGPWLQYIDDSGSPKFRAHAGTYSALQDLTLDERTLITVVFDGANSKIYKDSSATPIWTGDLGTGGMSQDLVWGAGQDTPNLTTPIDGFEMLTFDGELTGSDLTNFLSYMTQKYTDL